MREAYRSLEDHVASGYDIVFVARNTIAGQKEDEVENKMKAAMKSCGLLDKH